MRPLIGHALLRTFNHDLVPGLQKMLEARRVGCAPEPLTSAEQRAWDVLIRAGEIDNCLSSLRIAILGIRAQAASPVPDVDEHRYHVENFLLRLTGLYDRACRFVGIVLGMEAQLIDQAGGNRAVINAARTSRGHTTAVLFELKTLFDPYWTQRNVVAHAAEFSNRDLGIFAGLARLEVDGVDPVVVAQLMGTNFSATATEFSRVVDDAETILHHLVDETMAAATT